MSTLTVVGFGLAILFVTVSGILANSLRHRRDELEEVESSRDSLELELKTALNEKEAARSDLQSKKERVLELLKISSDSSNKVATLENENAKLKARLSTAYERVGKRFQKIGKVV